MSGDKSDLWSNWELKWEDRRTKGWWGQGWAGWTRSPTMTRTWQVELFKFNLFELVLPHVIIFFTKARESTLFNGLSNLCFLIEYKLTAVTNLNFFKLNVPLALVSCCSPRASSTVLQLVRGLRPPNPWLHPSHSSLYIHHTSCQLTQDLWPWANIMCFFCFCFCIKYYISYYYIIKSASTLLTLSASQTSALHPSHLLSLSAVCSLHIHHYDLSMYITHLIS